MKKTILLPVAALLVAMTPGTASAQNGTTTTTMDDPALATPVQRDDDKDFPWGLIGVIGLAGLLGRKRNHDDARVDRTTTTNRSDTNRM